MNRKASRTLALIFPLVVFLSFTFLTGCDDSKPESVAATSGSTQSAAINAAFAAPLVATITRGSSPISGVLVTFTAPATGPSGTFAGGVNTATSDMNGVATSAAFTANGIIGGPYTVVASFGSSAPPADFILTNTAALSKTYSFYVSGTEVVNEAGSDPNLFALAGSVTIDTNGNVLGGEQDYNDAFGFTSPQPSGDTITGGNLTVDPTSGQGTLTLITNNVNFGVEGTETLGVQFANANHALVMQFDTTATSSGSMDAQTLPSTLSGNYAFTLSGVDDSYDPVAIGGVFSISGTTLQSGTYDLVDNGVTTLGTAFTGTVSAPDSFGRGTITDTGIPTLNYYIVGPEVIRLIDVDADDTGFGSAFGQGSGTFTNASLGNSVFGILPTAFAFPYAAAGQFGTDSAGNFEGVGDVDEVGSVLSAVGISGNYSIASNGYGSLTITSETLEDVGNLGIYMTDPNLNLNDPNNTTTGLGGALIADMDETPNGTGVLIPQTDTASASFAGNYAFGVQELNEDLEFDTVGQGSVTSGVLAGIGLLNDPGGFLSQGGPESGVVFSGTATPDIPNPGRYTMVPLNINAGVCDGINLTTIIYQVGGGQLFWIDEDNFGMSLGQIQQQGSLTGLSAHRKVQTTSKAKPKRSQC
jgi:hypothetical protein